MGVKHGLSHWGRNTGWGCSIIGCWKGYSGLGETKLGSGEDYKTRSLLSVLHKKYYSGGQIKKNEMGGACGIYIHTECPRRNVPDFGRLFRMLKYNDITQNTYIHSWTVTEIMAREKCGLLAGPRTVPVSWQSYPCPSLSVVSYYGN